MTPEQLKWDKHQWAEYLGCSIQLYKRARNFIESNYCVSIEQDTERKYHIALTKTIYVRNRYDQWRQCDVIQKTSIEVFDKYNDAVQYANETFIPSLTFKPDVADSLGVPSKILQTLHVHTR